jgi:penicillin-binding protein 2
MGKLPATVETLEIIRKGLWEVVNKREGTAWLVHLPWVDISGKTGTAQVVSRKTGDPELKEPKEVADSLKPHAWFVAYAPSVEPKIAVSVIVEHGEHGSSSAGPIAKEVITTYLKGLANRNAKKEETFDQLRAQF